MDTQKSSKLAYKVSSFENDDIVEFVVAGKFTMDSIEKIRKEVKAVASSLNARKLLCDISNLEGGAGYAETYFLATSIPSFYHNIHTAIVDVPRYAHLHSFHEYFTKMNGIQMKWFYDADEARAWLKSI